MTHNVKDAVNKLTSSLALPKEIILGLPIIQLLGSEELNVENYKRLTHYSQNCIKIEVKSGTLAVCGAGLIIKRVVSENIKIVGVINKIEYVI